MSNRIIVHKADHEGALHIDARTGEILTPLSERPEWADGYAVALLAERTGWYEQRLGQHLPDSLTRPEMLDTADLGWIAFDAEGEEVEIEADVDHRMDILAGIFNVDRENFDDGLRFENTLAEAEATHTYATQPTSEATLGEVEGVGFADLQRKTA